MPHFSRLAITIGLTLFLVGLTGCSSTSVPKHRLVNPFVGTGGHGHTYPGATAPFGMVQLSPDSRLTGWDGCGGYHYSDSIIYGFSVNAHLQGTGYPTTATSFLVPCTQFNRDATNWSDRYASRFSHTSDSRRILPGLPGGSKSSMWN